MWGEWRLTLKKAEHALQAGELERAGSLVSDGEVKSYRQARNLAAQVAEALTARAEKHLEQGDTRRAWRDLGHAERLNGNGQRLTQLRAMLVRQKLSEAQTYLDRGQPAPAVRCLDELAARGESSAEHRRLHETAVAWRSGVERAAAGQLAQGLLHIERALALAPDCVALQTCLDKVRETRTRAAELEAMLHQALAVQNWRDVLAHADALIALAPEHVQAQAARRRAWVAVGGAASGRGGHKNMLQNKAPQQATPPAEPALARADHRDPVGTVLSPRPHYQANESDEPSDDAAACDAAPTGARCLLWVDGVGGYLVCLGDRISIGQPAGWHVDVPIMADLSRLHAWVERDGEGYSVRAVRPATVNGRAVRDKAALADEATIALGHGVRLEFRRPSPLSSTARLELDAAHRLSLPVDAVLLMADTCIIGPRPSSHIVAPDWEREVILYRKGDELWCHTTGDFEVDGLSCRDRARLGLSSRVRGEEFSLAIEPVAK